MPAVGRALINRSFRDSLCATGGCGVGVDFFGAAFFVTFGAGGVIFFFTGGFTGGGVTFFGGLFTGGALTLPLRPSIMIFPSWV